ncbi:50S ribosomal protein L32 [bacterium]|jgi:ribosomal protein L32|nr:50S ribosomal protein L32 [bacterium]MBT6832295.1 50S ribosomal protein L32 [bacterium]MBT6996036.1 50S ribosomal protein L32 [bacterium]MBT7772311.1 50S ribosomal protein L32 [bacterium]
MSKKPVPSKKQCPSSTRSRHSAFVRGQRVKLSNQVVLDKCQKCGATKRRHFACEECGWYGDKKIVDVATKNAPIQEIKA